MPKRVVPISIAVIGAVATVTSALIAARLGATANKGQSASLIDTIGAGAKVIANIGDRFAITNNYASAAASSEGSAPQGRKDKTEPPVQAPPALEPGRPQSGSGSRDLELALHGTDIDQRTQAARNALTADNEAIRATAIRRLFDSAEPALRQIAIIWIFEQTQKHRLPLDISPTVAGGADLSEETSTLLNAMRGSSFGVTQIDRVTGSFLSSLFGGWWNGSVSYNDVFITGTVRHVGATMRLKPAENYQLRGELVVAGGQTFQISLSLL